MQGMMTVVKIAVLSMIVIPSVGVAIVIANTIIGKLKTKRYA